MGIATLYVDNFSGRGVKHTYKDQTKATVWGQVIDIFYGFNFLKAHQKVNKNKIGITGNSRGGSVAWMVLDKRINDIFLNQGEQFAASMPIAHQCDMGQQFKNPIPTKTTVLNVHGGADNYTIPEPCIEYEKQIFRPEVKKVGGSSSSYIGKGWYHSFFANWEAEYYRYLVTFGKHKEGIRCPLNYTTDEGYSPDEMTNFIVSNSKVFNTKEDYYKMATENPRGTFKLLIEALSNKKNGCMGKGAMEGGDWGWMKNDAFKPASKSEILKVWNPIFLKFWKENLL